MIVKDSRCFARLRTKLTFHPARSISEGRSYVCVSIGCRFPAPSRFTGYAGEGAAGRDCVALCVSTQPGAESRSGEDGTSADPPSCVSTQPVSAIDARQDGTDAGRASSRAAGGNRREIHPESCVAGGACQNGTVPRSSGGTRQSLPGRARQPVWLLVVRLLVVVVFVWP